VASRPPLTPGLVFFSFLTAGAPDKPEIKVPGSEKIDDLVHCSGRVLNVLLRSPLGSRQAVVNLIQKTGEQILLRKPQGYVFAIYRFESCHHYDRKLWPPVAKGARQF
jgi:hypothetical protein